MSTIQLTTKRTETKEISVEITFPSFYKQDNKYMAIIDESDIIKIWDSENFSSIDQGSFQADYLKREVVEAVSSWEKISEDEFRLIHEKTMKFFPYHPKRFM